MQWRWLVVPEPVLALMMVLVLVVADETPGLVDSDATALRELQQVSIYSFILEFFHPPRGLVFGHA